MDLVQFPRNLQLRAQMDLNILSIYLQLGVVFPLVKWSHNDLFWPIKQIIFSVFHSHILSQGKTICMLSVTLYVEDDSENYKFEFYGSTAA